MADYTINIFLDDNKFKRIEAAGLTGKVTTIDGKKAIQVEMSAKDQKKLSKGFPDLTFDAANACVLPADAEEKLLTIIKKIPTITITPPTEIPPTTPSRF